MTQPVANLIIALYEDEDGAENSLNQLKEDNKGALESVQAAVAVQKDANSGLHYKDVGLTPQRAHWVASSSAACLVS